MSTIDEIEALLARVGSEAWGFDEPSNWHGLAARVHPAGSGDPIAQVSLSGWGKRRGLAICGLIVALRNAAPDLIAVVRAAAKVAQHPRFVRANELGLQVDQWAMVEALAKLGVGP